MNLHEARKAIAAILEQIPESELPEPTRREDFSHEKYGTCYWFGSHGYYVGSCRDGKGNAIPSSFREDGLFDLFDREKMERLERAYWAEKAEATS